MPTNVTGMGALAGGVSGVPATAMPGGLQSAGMASIELGKKRMRDSNDDLLMVPRLMHGVHFPFFFVAGLRRNGLDVRAVSPAESSVVHFSKFFAPRRKKLRRQETDRRVHEYCVGHIYRLSFIEPWCRKIFNVESVRVQEIDRWRSYDRVDLTAP